MNVCVSAKSALLFGGNFLYVTLYSTPGVIHICLFVWKEVCLGSQRCHSVVQFCRKQNGKWKAVKTCRNFITSYIQS